MLYYIHSYRFWRVELYRLTGKLCYIDINLFQSYTLRKSISCLHLLPGISFDMSLKKTYVKKVKKSLRWLKHPGGCFNHKLWKNCVTVGQLKQNN